MFAILRGVFAVAHLSLIYFCSSQMMIGKFSRSLYVGNNMEYLSFDVIFGRIKCVYNN